MKGKKVIGIVVAAVFLVCLISSGWVFNILSKNNELIKSNEMATLQTTFVQQYGSQATIRQLVSPKKVYAALCDDGNGNSFVTWNIGGLWKTVWVSGNVTSP